MYWVYGMLLWSCCTMLVMAVIIVGTRVFVEDYDTIHPLDPDL